MSNLPDTAEKLYALADLDSERGYLAFLHHVVVDAQPRKLPFRRIAETWQWERAMRAAPALDFLGGVTPNYTGPAWFWNGYHKGSDKTHESARQLCYLLGWSKRRLNCYVCAGKEEQAALITKAMRGILTDNPWIAERVRVTELTATGTSGSELTLLTMNAYTSQGAFPDYIIAEEVTHWLYDEGRSFWESFVLGSINKRPNCVLSVSTNAGHRGSWQWDERNRISKSPYWSFYEAPVGGPLPTWMSPEKIEDASQGMAPGERDRLYRNRWVDPGEEHGYLTEAESLLCRDPLLTEVTHGDRYTEYYAVVDYGGVNDRTALGVMHAVPGTDTALVDRLDCWQGTHENRIAIIDDGTENRSVEGWINVVRRNFRLAGLILDPAQMEGLAIKFERAGLNVIRFEYRGGKANHRLAQILKTSVQNRKVSWSPGAGKLPPHFVERGRKRLVEDDTFEKELAMLVTKPMSYGYRIDHESGRHDDRAICVGMGLLHVLPNALPPGSHGPKGVSSMPPVKPIGSTPSVRPNVMNEAVGRHRIMGIEVSDSGDRW